MKAFVSDVTLAHLFHATAPIASLATPIAERPRKGSGPSGTSTGSVSWSSFYDWLIRGQQPAVRGPTAVLVVVQPASAPHECTEVQSRHRPIPPSHGGLGGAPACMSPRMAPTL